MTTQAGPLHELTFSVEQERVAEFELWLAGLAEESLHKQGLEAARVFTVGNDAADCATLICQFQCTDDSAFNVLLDGFFADTEAAIAQEFGTTVKVSSRTLREDEVENLPAAVESPDCLNCGTRLRGQYCGNCGQRASSRLISLWELISDAFGDLLEFDSRLWRTLLPLLARPGRLTRDYLEGRRARYMPPFRTYLVLSVIFFIVAFFDPRDDLSLLFEPEPEPAPEEIAEEAAAAAAAKKEILDELAREGIIAGAANPKDSVDKTAERGPEDVGNNNTNTGFNIEIDDETGECVVDADGLSELPQWLQRRLTPERLKRVCERIGADQGQTLVGLMLDNIPVALIVLLPLMALVLKILYPLSRRYFVEHLLFVIHYHAYFFLMLILEILFARISALIHLSGVISGLVLVAASCYIPVYLYVAMRHVYGQGRTLTFIKYVALVICYAAGATLTMLGVFLFALFAV
ncbi:MAG: DUF3667 domain-containing protein [Gammaproteobacteria bacterium]|nr:DUF3667 domain-containing protein [Gammaproteobacteria bacterium]MBT8111319.1 DUF3667 domain-containing protein [Gammaproteobacteria bacterium]NND46078.1 DUF3667 domain-containing protein [Woeseiaceae bacterium]NNL46017.1 DUF3667 domain-containing protein [Woeseiaceae bacterium]